MNKRTLLIGLLSFMTMFMMAQTKSKYIPTKYDTIKKVVPVQVYGNPKDRKKADSILAAKQMQEKEQERLKYEAAQEEKKQAEIRKNIEVEQLKAKELKSEKAKNEKPKNEKAIPEKAVTKPKKDKTLYEEQKENYAKGNSNYLTSWTLQRCVEFARDNNLQIAESELNQRMMKLINEQAKASRLPSVNADANIGESYGRSIDPTSNQFVTKGFLYNSLGLNSQALVFGWFQKKYQVEQSLIDMKVADAAFDQLKDDISLNVATGFLRVLLAREQVKVNEAQIHLDNDQFQQTAKFVSAGKLPELNQVQMMAQLSNDTSLWVAAKSDERIALLQLRAIMNFNFEQKFDIQAPNIDVNELAGLYMLPGAEEIYNISLKKQHRMKYNELKLLSANKTLDIAKAVQYPQLSVFLNLGTNFSSNVKDITGQTYIGETPIGDISIGGTSYPITRPEYNFTTKTRGLFDQYGDNVRANGGIGLSIPILNGYSARTNIQKAKIGLVSQQIAMDNDKQKLKQDIYTAYEQAKASSQKYNAARRSQEAAQKALDFAVKRFGAGMINTFEYTSILNNLYTATSSALSSKYDLIFKLKVLDYYMGNPLKL